MLPALHHDLVELLGVCEVEVPHHHECAGGPSGAPHVGMQGSFAEVPAGAVAQMADVDFTRHLELVFDGFWIVFKGNVFLSLLVTLFLPLLVDAAADALHVLSQALKDGTDTLNGVRAALTKHVGQAGRHVELAAADAEAVLPAVTDLLHQRLQGVEAVEGVAIFRVIVAERFFKPHDSNAALMPDRVAHLVRKNCHLWQVAAGMQPMPCSIFSARMEKVFARRVLLPSRGTIHSLFDIPSFVIHPASSCSLLSAPCCPSSFSLPAGGAAIGC